MKYIKTYEVEFGAETHALYEDSKKAIELFSDKLIDIVKDKYNIELYYEWDAASCWVKNKTHNRIWFNFRVVNVIWDSIFFGIFSIQFLPDELRKFLIEIMYLDQDISNDSCKVSRSELLKLVDTIEEDFDLYYNTKKYNL